MKRKINLEVTMDRVKVFHQLVPGTKSDDEIIPDDESINTIFALMILRESQLPTIEHMPFFFRTYFVVNLLENKFVSDRHLNYKVNMQYWSQDNSLFLFD